jgi:ribosome biogenesis protein BMS1
MLLCLGGGAGIKDAPSKKSKAKAPAEAEEEGETFYDAMKKEMGRRLARTRAALDALDEEQRLIMEGHRPGAYLRLSFRGMSQAQQA